MIYCDPAATKASSSEKEKVQSSITYSKYQKKINPLIILLPFKISTLANYIASFQKGDSIV